MRFTRDPGIGTCYFCEGRGEVLWSKDSGVEIRVDCKPCHGKGHMTQQDVEDDADFCLMNPDWAADSAKRTRIIP
jgi:DnaJ-class molecular chaperone